MKIFVLETTEEETEFTLNSLLNSRDEIEEIDYELPIEIDETLNPLDLDIFIISQNPTFGDKFKVLESVPELEEPFIVMKAGFFSINYKELQKINIEKPTLFKTYPYGFNFRTENSFVKLNNSDSLIELGLNGQLTLSEKIIGIDHDRFFKFRLIDDLSPVRIALSLETKIQFCSKSLNKLRQLSKAKYSLRKKYRDLSALKTRKTNDRVLKNYIRLLDSFGNSCSKKEYVFFCMMQRPDQYQKAIEMDPFLLSLCEVNPNETESTNIYSLLVDYTLAD